MAKAADRVNGEPATTAVGEEIRRARTALGLTQRRYAERIGVSQQTVGAWENGTKNPEPPNVRALISKGGARPEPFAAAAGVQAADAPPEGSTSVRQQMFRRFYTSLSELYRHNGIALEEQDLAWRIINLWTRAVMLDHPETLAERMDFVVRQERQRIKRSE